MVKRDCAMKLKVGDMVGDLEITKINGVIAIVEDKYGDSGWSYVKELEKASAKKKRRKK